VSIGKYMQIFERNLMPPFSDHPKKYYCSEDEGQKLLRNVSQYVTRCFRTVY